MATTRASNHGPALARSSLSTAMSKRLWHGNAPLNPLAKHPRADTYSLVVTQHVAPTPSLTSAAADPSSRDVTFHLSPTTVSTALAAPQQYTLAPPASMPHMTPVPSANSMLPGPTSQTASSPHTATIVGAVVGSVLAFALILVLGLCCWRRRRRHRRQSFTEHKQNDPLPSSTNPTIHAPIPPATAELEANDPIPNDPFFATRRNASSWPSRLSSAVTSLRPTSHLSTSQPSLSAHDAYHSLPELPHGANRTRTFSSLFSTPPASASAPRAPPSAFTRFLSPPRWSGPQRSPAKQPGTAPRHHAEDRNDASEKQRQHVQAAQVDDDDPIAGPPYRHSPLMTRQSQSSANWPLRASTRLSRTFVGKWRDTDAPPPPPPPVLQFPPPALRPTYD